MHERIVEILLFLVNELRTNKQLNDVDVTLLTRNGYTQSEISTAFSWLFEQMDAARQPGMAADTAAPVSRRVLNEIEKSVIRPEAYGFLLQVNELGLLDAGDVEVVIDRIMSAGFGQVGEAEMKSLIAGVLFDADLGRRGGGRLTVGSNDSIH